MGYELMGMLSTSHLNDCSNLKEAVALGLVPGWRSFRKFGTNDSLASGTDEMWPLGTSRVRPTSAAVASAVSTAAADDVGSTGALTLTIEGLDANYLEVSETIAMDGTTPSATTQTFLRVNRAYIATAGTGQTNAGHITITVGGDAQAYVEASEGQTHQTHYTVPADHTSP